MGLLMLFLWCYRSEHAVNQRVGQWANLIIGKALSRRDQLLNHVVAAASYGQRE